MNSRIVLSLIACILLLGTAGVAYAGSVVTTITVTSPNDAVIVPDTNRLYVASNAGASSSVYVFDDVTNG